MNRVAVLALCLLLGGCLHLGPHYEPPELPVPAAWQQPAPVQPGVDTVEDPDAGLAEWWRHFDDPQLDRLLALALDGNLSLAEAEARLLESRARVRGAESAYWPQLGLGLGARRSSGNEQTGTGVTRDFYSAGFDASWELDIFGVNRRSVEAARADREAVAADLDDVRISLAAEIAQTYVELRGQQVRLDFAYADLAAQREILELIRWRAEAGLVSAIDVERAETLLQSLLAEIPALQGAITNTGNRIAVLTGVPPGALDVALLHAAPLPEPPLTLAVTIPADTLRRRPDVRRAERQLAAQTARQGVAVAARYPRFTLSGSLGLESLDAGRLLRSSAQTESVGAGASWTIFDGGALRAAVDAQDAITLQVLARLELTALNALQEVESSLVNHATELERRAALEAAVAHAETAFDLARMEHDSGLTDYQTLLDSQRSLLSAQDQWNRSRVQATVSLIALYKALGGGW